MVLSYNDDNVGEFALTRIFTKYILFEKC